MYINTLKNILIKNKGYTCITDKNCYFMLQEECFENENESEVSLKTHCNTAIYQQF